MGYRRGERREKRSDEREEEDPYDVDKVPIEAHEFDGLVILLRESDLERLPRDVCQREDARGHVGSMDAGLGIERRTIERVDRGPKRRVGEGEALPEIQVLVLEGLDAQERDSEEKRREEVEPVLHFVVALDRGERLDHRQAAADENERIQPG